MNKYEPTFTLTQLKNLADIIKNNEPHKNSGFVDGEGNIIFPTDVGYAIDRIDYFIQ